MADPEVKININTEYDGAAAKQALLDIENLPLEAQGLAEVFNQNFAAVETMEEGLRRATEQMRAHIASLDPAAEGYAKAVSAAQGFITRQVTLAQQCEKVRGALVGQATTIEELAASLARGSTSEAAFANALEGISQKGIAAEQSIERLAAQMDALNARQAAATNLSTAATAAMPAAPAVPAAAMSSWRGFFNYIRRGAATSTSSLSGLMQAAGGLARIGTWGTVAKVAFDGLGKSFRIFSDQLGMGIDKSTTLSNVFQGFLGAASEGVATIVTGTTSFVTGAGEATQSTNSWASSLGEVLNNLARMANYKQELAALAKQEQHYNKKLATDQKAAQEDLRTAAQEGVAQELDAKIEQARTAAEQLKQSAESDRDAESRTLEARRAAAERELEVEQEKVELARSRGEISQEAAEQEKVELQSAHDEELAAIDAAAAALEAKYKDALASAASSFQEQLDGVTASGELAKWAPVLQVEMPDVDRLRVLTDQLKGTEKAFGEKYTQEELAAQQQLIDERAAILDQVRALAATINGIDSTLGVNEENAVSFTQKLQECTEKLDALKEKADAQAQVAEEAVAVAAEGVGEAQKELASTQERTRLSNEIAKNDRETAEAKAAAAAQEKERKRTNDAIKAQLRAIEESYKTSRSYAQEDSRTEAQKITADRGILEARIAQLRELKATATTGGADADTQRRINTELRGAESELRGYRAALAAGRTDASRALQSWKTQGPAATNNVYQGNVKNLQRSMDTLARQYERAAAKGDTAAMERINSLGQQCAQNLEKLTDYTGNYSDQWLQIQADGKKLQESYRGLSVAEEKELSTLQKNERHTARRESLENKINQWKEKHAAAEQKTAAAAERSAQTETRAAQRAAAKQAQDAAQQAAAQAKQGAAANAQGQGAAANAQGQSAAAAAQQIAAQQSALQQSIEAMSSALQEATSALQATNASMSAATASIASITTAVQGMGNTASQMASTAGSGAAAAAAAIAAMNAALSNLQAQVNRLSSLS